MTDDTPLLHAAPVRLRPEILATPPYRQGKAAGADAFKLSSNENPFDPLPGVIEAVTDATRQMNRYPDAAATRLREALAARLGVTIDEIHVGSGSVALLSQFIIAAAGPGDEVVYSWRSFEAYPGLVTVAGATNVQVPNRADAGHDLRAMANAITDRTRVVIVCSPNNPTGSIVTEAEFAALMERVPNDVLVILDEAYGEFVSDDEAVRGIPLLDRYPNLVVLHTFSKAYGLAGLRVGWAVGHSRILDGARATAIPLSVTGQAEVAAIASLAAETELLDRVRVIAERRDVLWASLTELGVWVPKSEANFIWLATGDETDAAAQTLLENGVVARAFSGSGIRVSVGEAESVQKILAAVTQIVRFLPQDHPMKRIT